MKMIRDVRVCLRVCARYDKIAAESAVANFRYRILFIVYEYTYHAGVPDPCGVSD